MESRRVLRQGCTVALLVLICLAVGPPAAQASGDILTVGQDGEFDTIKSALEAADEGDTILVKAGEYENPLTITTPNITIRSQHGPERTTIEPASDKIGRYDSNIAVNAPNVTIRGFTVRRHSYAIEVDTFGDRNGWRANISNNRFEKVEAGVIISSRYERKGRNTVKNNTFSGLMFHEITVNGASNNRIVGNRITDGGDTIPLSLYDSHNNSVYLNTFVDNRVDVLLDNSTDNRWMSPPAVYDYNGSRLTGPLGNYWDRYDGADTDGDGIGEQAYKLPYYDREIDGQLIEKPTAYTYSPESPLARTGANRTVPVEQTVTLDGENSSDPADDRLSYEWTMESQPSDSGVTLRDESTATAEFSPDTAGTYTIGLTVTDTDGHSDTTNVSVTANAPPTARAGANMTTAVGDATSVDASNSSDPTGDALTYEWDLLTTPADSTASLSDTSTVAPTLTPDVHGEYVLKLTATDEHELSATDTVAVVTDGNPSAEIESAADTRVGSSITLDGRNSTDPENMSLDYTWTITSVPEETETSLARTAAPTTLMTPQVQGTYTIKLTVTDPQGNTGTDTQTVTANAPPRASLDVTPTLPTIGKQIQFDATGSTDPDGTIDAYRWDFDADGTVEEITESASVNHTYEETDEYRVFVTAVDEDGLNDTTSTVVTVGRPTEPSPTSLEIESPTSSSAVRLSGGEYRLRADVVIRYDQPLNSVPQRVGRGFSATVGNTSTTPTVQSVEQRDSTAVAVTLLAPVDGLQPGWHDLQVTLEAEPACKPGHPCPTVIRTLDDTVRDVLGYRLDARENDNPTATFTYAPSPPTTGDWLLLNGFESTDPDGGIETYQWQFDGRETADAVWGVGSGWFTDHRFEQAGDQTVSLTVTDDDGATDTVTKTISVSEEVGNSASVEIDDLELAIEEVGECGVTCRNVTYVLTNPTETSVTDLTADITLVSGGTTVWENERSLGYVQAGDEVTLTDEVSLDRDQMARILENDWEVTINVRLQSANETRTISFDREL